MKRRYKVLLFIILNIVATLLIPFLSVKLIPADAGMAVCMILFFAVYPILSMLIGWIATRDTKYFWWMPLASSVSFPLLFSIAMGGMVEELYVYSLIYTFLGYAILAFVLLIKKIRLERQKKQ